MRLKLHENIKRFRKEKKLTQEKLAETLGVTVGAVSKWENGNNTPDIVMLTELADFFDISIDVLLGYDLSSKKAGDIVEKINSLVAEHRFEEAESVSRDAITRYPHDFAIIYASAMIYHVKAMENQNVSDARKAIDLLTKSADYLSQNNNPDINDFVIRSQIAYNYIIVDAKAALERFKELNFGGINDTIIALVYLQNAEVNQALNYCTNGLINHISDLINSFNYMVLALTCTKRRNNIESALCIVDTILEIIRKFKKTEVGYFSKLEAFYYVLKAYLYACLGEEEKMIVNVTTGKNIAKAFDEKGSNDVAKNFRFYYSEKESYMAIDSIGENAVTGIESVLRKQITKIAGIDKDALKKVIGYWEKNDEEFRK